MHKHAFLLIEILIAIGIFATCSLVIALVSSHVLAHRINVLKQAHNLEHERMQLEKQKVTFTSRSIVTFMQAHGNT